MRKRSRKSLAILLTFVMLFGIANMSLSFAKVTKNASGYTFTLDFEGNPEDFYYDRNIVWDGGERIQFTGSEAKISKDQNAGIATVRKMGAYASPIWADVSVQNAQTGLAFGFRLSNPYTNIMDNNGLWFVMKEGSLSVVLGSEELYTYENASFASKKTVRIEDAMTSFQFTVDRTVLLTVKQNGKNIDILNAAGEVLKTAEGKQIEAAGHTKLASYGADSTIDNFGYNFVADDYLILPDDEQPTVTVSDNPQVDLLEGFGISTDGNMSVELNAEGNLTRGEAAFLTAGLIHVDRAVGTSRFADAAASIYSGSVAALEQMGAVSGLGPDYFGVDLEIRFQDLLSMMINAMGYQQLALARGGYPGGYLYIADFVGMMKGNTMAGTDVVSRQNAINLFARALESDNLEITGISGDSLQVVKNGTVAEAVHKAHKADGVVMEVGNYSMTADFVTDPGTINIDDKILYTNGNDYSMFIGMKVTYYYNDEAEILFMFDNKQNNIMTLDAAKVYDASLEEVLFEEDGRDKKVRVKDPIVLFNGNRKYNATGETLMPQAGELTFIDNDKNGKYDVIKVTSYKTIVAGAIDTENETVTDKYSSQVVNFSTDDNRDVKIFNSKGTEATLSSIKSGNIVMYASDDAGKITQALVSNEKVTGVVTKISGEAYTVAGKEYVLAASFQQALAQSQAWAVQPKISASYNLYLNAKGEVAYVDKASSTSADVVYAILLRAGSDPSPLGDAAVMVEAYTQFGEKVMYPLADNVKINGTKNMKSSDVLALLSGFVDKVIRIKVGQDAITELETPIDKGKIDYAMLGKEFNMLNVSEVLGDVRNKPTAQALNFRLGLSGDTVVFQTSYKTDGTLDTKATLIVRGTSFASEEQFVASRQVYAYDIDKNLVPAVLTMTAGSAGGGETAQMVMVNEITTGLNADDEIVTYARGLSGGNEVEYIIPDVDPSASEAVQKTQQFVKDYVTEGCTGIFMINSLNEIVDIRTTDNSTGVSDSSLGISSRFLIPPDVLKADATTYYGLKNSGGDVMHHWAIKGRVFTISGDIITVTTANTMEQMTVANTYYIRLAGPMSVYEISNKKNKCFEKSSTSKIRSSQDTVLDGSLVLVNVKDYMVNDIIVIN